MEGGFTGIAGIVVNAGNATASLRHVIMNNWFGPQPPYGVLVTDSGEFTMSNECDIMQVGCPVALIPGLGGVLGQSVVAAKINNCYLDSPSGLGGLYVSPRANAFVSTLTLSSVWVSTASNG